LYTKDNTHFVSLISKLLESRCAHFLPIYSIALDFSSTLTENNYDANDKPNVDTIINLTGFTHPSVASQDDKKTVNTLKKLILPYTRAMPLVVQSLKEWQLSDLGLCLIQVLLNVLLPVSNCPIKPMLYAGNEWATVRSVQLADCIN
jgi:cobalamin biosynthesis Mg chelatase CobN